MMNLAEPTKMKVKCVLLALIWVTHSVAAELAPAKPLSQADILGLLTTRTDVEDVAHLVQKRGIDFVPDNKYLQTLRDLGAEELFAALCAAKHTTLSKTTDSAAERGVLAHARKCARLELKLPWWEGREKAQKECRAALKYAPDNPFLLLALGSLVRGLGKSDDAIVLYRRALALDPSLAAPHVEIATVLRWDKGDKDLAIAELREAIRVDSDYAAAHWQLGSALEEKGDTELAIAEQREALRLEPNSAGLHAWLALVLLKKGDIEGATVEYREAVRLAPAVLSYRTGLAAALYKKGDTDGAIAEYREALHLVPNSPEVHNALGYMLDEKGDTDDAIAEFLQALLHDPKLALAHFGLGQAFEKKGDLAHALEEYGAAARLEPNNSDYRKHYQMLSRKSN